MIVRSVVGDASDHTFAAILDVGVEPDIIEPTAVALLANALRGRAEASTQVALHRRLEADESFVAELVGQSHDGGGPGIGRGRQIGDRPERHDLGVVEQYTGDPALRRGELLPPLADPLGDAHRHRP